MILSEKFENVIKAVPEKEDGQDYYVLSQQAEEFRRVLKALS